MKFIPASTVALGLGVLSAGCTVTVDSHSEIVREEKRFTVDGRGTSPSAGSGCTGRRTRG